MYGCFRYFFWNKVARRGKLSGMRLFWASRCFVERNSLWEADVLEGRVKKKIVHLREVAKFVMCVCIVSSIIL